MARAKNPRAYKFFAVSAEMVPIDRRPENFQIVQRFLMAENRLQAEDNVMLGLRTSHPEHTTGLMVVQEMAMPFLEAVARYVISRWRAEREQTRAVPVNGGSAASAPTEH
jgi:hypothetical protein